jgi:biopolymer transport protein ExbD
MKLTRHRRPTIAIMDMTPMIDIVFLLLIFFMTVSQVSEINKVQLSLPKLEGSDEQKPAVITLNIDASGQMILSGRNVSLGEVISAVADELRRLGDDPSRLTFVLRTDERSESRPVNQVISALGRMQVSKVRLAVQSES